MFERNVKVQFRINHFFPFKIQNCLIGFENTGHGLPWTET